MSLPKNSLVVLLLAPSLWGQIPVRPPINLPVGGIRDVGVRVEMIESPRLGRFIRRAQEFLADEEYTNAISVLQSVVEGRTDEFMEQGLGRDETKQPEEQAVRSLLVDEENPAYSVFSGDGRLYRPVARLCHELLSAMPPEGVGLYRAKFEANAARALERALATGDVSGLEDVANRYFVTLAGGRALNAAAEMQMDSGQFRGAIQTLETLLGVYPQSGRVEAGLNDLYLMVKKAVCYRQLGEADLTAQVLAEIAQLYPEDSVRLMGELNTVRGLAELSLFGSPVSIAAARPSRVDSLDLLGAEELVPLWEYRFRSAGAYAAVRATRRSTSFRTFDPRQVATNGSSYPQLNDYVPGTTVQAVEDGLIFLDNYRPILVDPTSGRRLMTLGGPELATVPTASRLTNVPGSRIPAYDYFANRVAKDGQNYFVVEGFNQSTTATDPFRAIVRNTLVAYDRESGERAWFIVGGEMSPQPVTFLATPTPYRGSLLIPFLEGTAYGLMALSSLDGEELYRTYLHSRGTALVRAPAPLVVVSAGVAYVSTNAGILASVDANTGALNWSRKYEREHPRRASALSSLRTPTSVSIGADNSPQPMKLQGFAPSDLIVAHDLVILAAVDSKVLLCLDGATGDVVWMHDGERPTDHDLFTGQMRYIVGHNEDYLFVMCGDAELLCIGLNTGIRYWVAIVPEPGDWSGRGFVTDAAVVLPGRKDMRRIHVVPADTQRQPVFRSFDLPEFSIGRAPANGAVNIAVHGSFLLATYEDGVEAYTTGSALVALAEKETATSRKATYLVHAGQVGEAIELILSALEQPDLPPEDRTALSTQVLSLAEQRSKALATDGHRDSALSTLADCEARMSELRLKRRVHLFRWQVFRILGDTAGMAREQEYIENGGIK